MRACRFRSVYISLATLILLTGFLSPARAQFPAVATVYPPGGQRGTTVEVTVTGQKLAGPTKVLFDDARLRAEVVPGPHNNDGSCKIKVQIDGQAPAESYFFRIATAQGLASPARFAVGTVPQLAEVEPNNERAKAQRLETPRTIIGRIDGAEDLDWFVVAGKKGAEFIFEVNAGRLGSGLDSDLYLYNAAGRLVAANGDFQNVDSFLAYRFPEDGDYHLLLRDYSFRGGGNFTYRLTVGELPFILSAHPSGGQIGTKVKTVLRGPNLGSGTEREIDLTQETRPGKQLVWAETAQGVSNAVEFMVSESSAEQVEPPAMPNHERGQAMKIAAPGMVSGVLDESGKPDYFAFPAKKGEQYSIEIFSRRLGSPMDPVLDLYDESGKAIQYESDDTQGLGRDTRFPFTVSGDGTYTIRVRDRHDRGGMRMFYRLAVETPRPDFTLLTNPADPFVRPGNLVLVTVTAQKTGGFNEAIKLELPGLPKGVIASEAAIAAGQSQVLITLTGAPDATPDAATFVVRGRAMTADKSRELVRDSTGQITVFQDNQPQVRPENSMAIAVGGAPDYRVTVEPAKPEVIRGQKLDLTIKVQKREGFKAQFTASVQGAPPGTNVTTANIAEDKDSAVVALTIPAGAAPGTYRIYATAGIPAQRVFYVVPVDVIVKEK